MLWFISTLLCVATARIGMQIHDSVFWAIMDFLFPYFAWLKWLILHQVNMTIIHNAFSWFFT